MTDREQELKLTIASESDWSALCAALPAPLGAVEQINSYWDHPDGRLHDRQILLRVRLEDPRAFVTVKSKASRDQSGYFQASEREEEIPVAEARVVVDAGRGLENLTAEPLVEIEKEFHDIQSYRCWGTTRNLRRKFALDDDLVAEVDRTDYGPGGIHYEVELESSDPVRARSSLDPFLALAGITVVASQVTKSERLQRLLGADS